MGEGESLYGGLDRSTVYTAQSVLQLQKLLIALSNSRRVAGGVETLQSQQVQLGIWVVSDLVDNHLC